MAESREQGGGSSGRRSGVERRPRVRGRSLALRELIRRVGDELIEAESVGEPSATTEALLSRRERVVRRLWESALRGDLLAIRLLVEYTEGKPPGGAGSGETAKAGRAVTPFSADELAAAMSEVLRDMLLRRSHPPSSELPAPDPRYVRSPPMDDLPN